MRQELEELIAAIDKRWEGESERKRSNAISPRMEEAIAAARVALTRAEAVTQDAKDAVRYRWIRASPMRLTECLQGLYGNGHTDAELDAMTDAAIDSAMRSGGPEGDKEKK